MRIGRISLKLPPPTVRLRMTALYGLVFLITGAVLLTIGYELVRHNLNNGGDYRSELRKLFGAPPPHPFGFEPGSVGARYVDAIRAQLRADALHRLLIEYIFALGGMTIVSVVAGWLLAGRALRPLREITATARRVSGENLGERIALKGPADELKELADTFDGMLARLDGAFASQRHFVANASHELRTPLAIMRTEVDVSLADPDASVEDLRRMGEAVRDTIDRCERLIEGLLMLARSEAAVGREEPVDLAALAADCITDLRARAEEAHVEVQDDLEPAWTSGRARAARADDRQPDRQRHPPQRAGRLAARHNAGRGRPRSSHGGQRRGPHRSGQRRPADRAVPPAGARRRRFRTGPVDRALGGHRTRRDDGGVGPGGGRARGADRAAGAGRAGRRKRA